MNHTLITIREDGTQWTEHCATTKEVFGSMKRQKSIADRSSVSPPKHFLVVSSAMDDTVVQMYDYVGKAVGVPLSNKHWARLTKEIADEKELKRYKML